MAKTTVEILGGSLDGTVLNNMASEATMRELLSAVKKMGGSTGGGAGAAGARRGGSPSKLSKSMNIMSSLADGLGQQIGNTVGALGTMGAMLAMGNTKLSSYTKTLNDQVISKLPIFGGLLGGLGGLLNDGIEVLEDWNESLKTGTDSGATFGNSILRASAAATSAGMSLDAYMKLTSQYSSTMLNLGNTVTEGAERFSKISRLLVRSGGIATKTLRQMGYSTQMVNESFLKYIEMMGMGLKNSKTSDKELAESFDSFQLNLIRMGYLTGQNVKKLEEQMAVVAADSVFRLELATLGKESREQMLAAAQQYTATYGEAGGELFKAIFLGMPPGSEEARNLAVLMPGVARAMQDSITTAKKGQGKVEEYIEKNEDKLIAAMVDSARRGKGIQGILAAAGAGYGDAEKLRKSIEPILRILAKQGDLSKITTEQLKTAFKAARDEARERDKVTEFMNNISMAFEELKFGLMETFLPYLEELGKYLESKDLPGKVKQFGVFLTNAVKTYLPDVITFFKWLGDKDGRDYIMNEVGYFFSKMGIKFEYYIKEALGFDSPETYQRDMEKDLNNLKTEYTKRKTDLEPKVDPLRYRPGEVSRAPATQADVRKADNQATAPPAAPSSRGGLEIYDRTDAAGLAPRGGQLKNVQGTIIHHTGSRNLEGAITTLNKSRNEKIKKSYNFIIDRDGAVHQILPDGTVAYHAGDTPKMPHLSNLNTIGISLAAKDDSDVTPTQLNSLAKLQAMLSTQYGFKPGSAYGHGETSIKQPTEGLTGAQFLRKQFSQDGAKPHRTGTLGQYGTLFKNYGTETKAILDGVETVMTPQQMNAMMNTAGNVATTELLSSIDRNFSVLANLLSERANLSRSQLSHLEKLNTRIA